jgi:hypothetical protein
MKGGVALPLYQASFLPIIKATAHYCITIKDANSDYVQISPAAVLVTLNSAAPTSSSTTVVASTSAGSTSIVSQTITVQQSSSSANSGGFINSIINFFKRLFAGL